MTRKEIKFTDIVQMIADGTVPEGAKFYTPEVVGLEKPELVAEMKYGALYWVDGEDEGNTVPIMDNTVTDTWYIEVPEVELSLQEAIAEWKAGKGVEVKFEDESFLLYSWTDLYDVCDETPLSDFGDLLFKSKFYKVAA
ncbi:hypothetical protein P7G87_00515 [Enterococcus asini]|uniref:hypothetical protein n=1 Tax=Enterococcus asini TaxID=57732 RepID=UPI00289109CF|nr:hypothetical protein [Enterococcus asini]MDT2783170.1 hypothetical protein [Enterococcus asini]